MCMVHGSTMNDLGIGNIAVSVNADRPACAKWVYESGNASTTTDGAPDFFGNVSMTLDSFTRKILGRSRSTVPSSKNHGENSDMDMQNHKHLRIGQLCASVAGVPVRLDVAVLRARRVGAPTQPGRSEAAIVCYFVRSF